MKREDAEELADFVNRGNERYRAEALPVGEYETWVVLADAECRDVTPPPVIDPDEYLADLRTSERLPTECQLLLAAWLARRTEGSAARRSATGPAADDDCAAAPTLALKLDLPTDPQHVTVLRRAACLLLESVGVGGRCIADVEVLIGELATNAVLHAGTDCYAVEIEVRRDRILVIVSDRGRGIPEPSRLPAPGAPRAAGEAPAYAVDNAPGGEAIRFGGWGLPLVYSLADRVEVYPTLPDAPCGTTVRAEMLVDRPQPQHAFP